MKTLVLYYSRTGTTRTVARAVADRLDADIAEIKCARHDGGWFHYLRAGYESVTGRIPEIELPDIAFADYDLVILGGPIWTSYPSLPLRAFLAKKPPLPDRVGLIVTCGAHSPPEKAIQFVSALLPLPLVASLSLPQSIVDEGQFHDRVASFIDGLQVPQSDQVVPIRSAER